MNQAATHHKFGQREKPISALAIACRAGVYARHPNMAAGVTANSQLGLINLQLMKLTQQQRTRRQRHPHARQKQRLSAFAVEELHLRELKAGHPPAALGADAADFYPQTQCARGLLLQSFAVVTNSRHNENVQSAPS